MSGSSSTEPLDQEDCLYYQGLDKAWKHWQENQEDFDYFGFRDWLLNEYGLTYGNTKQKTNIRFRNSHGRLRFFLEWV